jgi:hypothetical protein
LHQDASIREKLEISRSSAGPIWLIHMYLKVYLGAEFLGIAVPALFVEHDGQLTEGELLDEAAHGLAHASDRALDFPQAAVIMLRT